MGGSREARRCSRLLQELRTQFCSGATLISVTNPSFGRVDCSSCSSGWDAAVVSLGRSV